MTDTTRTPPTVSASGIASLRVRPAVMLLVVRVRAAEATLDLGLASVKRQCADAVRRLTRLGAVRVEAGEPHADDHANPDPMAKIRAAAMPRKPNDRTPAEPPGVNVALTATWDVAAMTAEEVLGLVDRLQFDVAADAEPEDEEDDDETPSWNDDPQEQMRKIMEQVTAVPDDRSPKFLFVVRPTDDEMARATAEAYETARRSAELLARAAGRRLGPLASLHAGTDVRADRMMERQRCAAVLAATTYELGPQELASDDPRAAEVVVGVHATHHLE